MCRLGLCTDAESAASESDWRQLVRWWCGLFVVLAHFCSDPIGTGVFELVENCQCVLPGNPGELRITKVMVGVSEGDKAVGFVVTVAELAAQVDGLLVAGYGLFVVAEMAMGVAQAV